MKKTLAIVLMLALSMGLMAGCGTSSESSTESSTESETYSISYPYADLDLNEYVTLPDYSQYTVGVPDVEISSADVQEEISNRLTENAEVTHVTEGVVENGDKVNIAFDGTLEDGTKSDQMTTDSYDLTIGTGTFIDGFEEGLIGVNVGDTVTLDLQFPDPYTANPDYSGMGVSFEVTVNYIIETTAQELDEAFIQEDSDGAASTQEEYREYLKGILEKEEYDDQMDSIYSDLYTEIMNNVTVLQYPDGAVDEEKEYADAEYKEYASQYGYSDDWEGFLELCGIESEEAYQEQLQEYAESTVMQDMAIYLIAENEDVDVSDEGYTEYLMGLLTDAGYESAADFESASGYNFKEYAESHELDRDYLIMAELDVIYNKLLQNN